MRWDGGSLWMLDQRRLPGEERWIELTRWEDVAEAIRDMAVRGAPAIGIAAAYGMALAAKESARPFWAEGSKGEGTREAAAKGLAASRPTAVNLSWAIERMSKVEPWIFENALEEAQRIEQEDLDMNLRIGEHGVALVLPLAPPRGQTTRRLPVGPPADTQRPPPVGILTICNTGGLATSGHGTALGVIRTAWEQGKNIHVYACETRPRMQGLKLTAWELKKDGIPFHSIADGAAGSLMREGRIDLVIAGADRIAANGDAANKIGTYSLAVLARHHGIPFYIAAPSSTLDPLLTSGDLIPIEERAEEELTEFGVLNLGPGRPDDSNLQTPDSKVRLAPDGCPVLNPAFDVTPAELITAIITETATHRPPFHFSK